MLIQHSMTKEEFGIKWEASKERFYRFAFAYVKNEGDALEILSEATYKAFSNLHSLKEPAFFNTWFNRIIINEAYSFLKRVKRFVPMEEETVIHAFSEDEYSHMETKLDVYELLDKVSDEEKTLIILKYFEDKSFKEISVILNMKENTVKAKLYRTLNKLKTYIEGELK